MNQFDHEEQFLKQFMRRVLYTFSCLKNPVSFEKNQKVAFLKNHINNRSFLGNETFTF
jgi:hypothetical protein